MYTEINVNHYKNEYILYYITDVTGSILQVNIVKFTDSTAFIDLPKTQYDKLYQVIIAKNTDKEILLNNAILWANSNNCQHLLKQITLTDRMVIICNETGEKFNTATEVCAAHNLSYSAVINHLKGKKSFNSVKGKTYKRVSV